MVIADGLREILCLTLVGKLCQGLCSERAGAGAASFFRETWRVAVIRSDCHRRWDGSSQAGEVRLVFRGHLRLVVISMNVGAPDHLILSAARVRMAGFAAG